MNEIKALFLEGFISDLDEFPDWYSGLYGVPLETIKSDPEYYFNLDVRECDNAPKVRCISLENKVLEEPKSVAQAPSMGTGSTGVFSL